MGIHHVPKPAVTKMAVIMTNSTITTATRTSRNWVKKVESRPRTKNLAHLQNWTMDMTNMITATKIVKLQ